MTWYWLGGDASNSMSTYFLGTVKSNSTRNYTVNYPQTSFHSMFQGVLNLILGYAIDWTDNKIDWIIDGIVVRTDTIGSLGINFPKLPCLITMSVFCGGCKNLAWAGGPTVFGPNPFVMTLQSLEIINYNPAANYSYYADFPAGPSGAFGPVSINSPASASSKGLSKGVIGGAVGGVISVLIILGAGFLCWVRHKRRIRVADDRIHSDRYPTGGRVSRKTTRGLMVNEANAESPTNYHPRYVEGDNEVVVGGRLGQT